MCSSKLKFALFRHLFGAVAILLSVIVAGCGGGVTGQGGSEDTASAIEMSAVTMSPNFGRPAPVSEQEVAARPLALYFDGSRASTENGLIGTDRAANGDAFISKALAPLNATSSRVHRFYNTLTGAHFYTISEEEKKHVQEKLKIFQYEGPTFMAFTRSETDLSPVYRFYNKISGSHFYTINESEKNHIIAAWPDIYAFEGVGWYASKLKGDNWVPVYRFFNKSTGTHFYTPNESEREGVIAKLPQFVYEGIAYYGKTCSVAGGSGSGTGADIDDTHVSCSTYTYRIGGAVSGLGNGRQLTLHNNGGDTLTLRSNGVFFFPSPVAHGGSYRVTVGTQPNGQTCTVAGGTGVQVIAEVNSVVITCSVHAYRLAGRVSGLAHGKQVTLWNNGADALTLAEDGPFSFQAPVAHGGSYNITVAAQPVGQTCSVIDGQGFGVVQDVDGVRVACSVSTFSVGGSLVGLGAGKQVTLLNNGGDHLPLTRDGGFTFRSPVAYGSTYDVSVGTQPIGQTCVVTEGEGSDVRADVSRVTVACAANLYTVAGTLQGLGASKRVRIQMNGGEVLTLTSNGAFSFSSRLHEGQYYGVRLLSQPIGSHCDITESYGHAWRDVNSIAVSCVALSQNRNPVGLFDFPDPTVIHGDDGYYYAYATGGAIVKSPNLATWTYVGSYIQAPGWNWGTAGAGVWAPDILKLGGKYLLYYSLSTWGDPNPGIGVAVANSPAGPWVDHGKLFTSSEIGVNNSIDPHTFIADDGRVILAWGSMRGNFMVELSPDGLSLKDGVNAHQKKVQVAGLPTSFGWDGRTYEGVYVLRHGSFYYLFLSTGSCCDGLNSDYRVVVGRSVSPTGPFVDHMGRDLRARSVGYPVVAGSDMFRGPGHNTLSQDSNGDWWMVYHSWVSSSPGIGRALMVDRLNWDSNGWPSIYGGGPHVFPFQ